MVLAVRPRQLPDRLSAALERAHREGVLTRIELGALDPVEARAFLGEAVEAVQAAALFKESGGNPFYLQQLARALELTGGAASAAAELSSAIEVPSAVAAALTEELGLLSQPARLVLQGGAVAGDPFEPELAAAAAGASEDSTMEAVDELLSSISSARPTCRGGSDSGTRSCDGRSTRPPRAAGDSARTSGAPRRSRHAVRPRWRARTTSSARRARATSARLRSCARPARQQHDWRPKALRDGSVGRCGC